MERIEHLLEPVFDASARVLILGTMPSPKSRERLMYYGHPQNRFWPTMAAVLGRSLPDGAAARYAMLQDRGIALWDVLAACDIEGASDSSIKNAVPNDLRTITDVADIQAVFTTGKKAHALYQRYMFPDIGLEDVCLPSPSPANCAVKPETLTEAYRAILKYCK